jgi:hypothetical protein
MTFTAMNVRSVLAYALMLLCLIALEFGVAAQNSGILSKRPLVTRLFDRDKNESTISALLIDPQSDTFREILVAPPPDIRFHSVEYTYSGPVPSRPQTVAFIFVPADKYKIAPNFSITADGAVLQQGNATLRELCCVKINGYTDNPQHIVIAVPVEIFDRITHASKVEFKLTSKRGKYSFKLNDYQRKCLTALVDTMK